MRFAQIYYNFGFWMIAVLAVFLIWAFKKKKALMRRFADEALLQKIAFSVNTKKQIIKSSLIIIALIFSVLALMRPQWGFQWQEVKRKGLDILIAIDTSKSMLASDVKPNRLERARLAVKDLIGKLRGDRIGLIAFSGAAFLQCPLTADYSGFLLALEDLDIDVIPRGGTSISSAIETARKSYEGGEKKYKILIIITDGEDHEGGVIKAVQAAGKQGIKIFCIGIGTKDGELVRVLGRNGRKVFLKDKEGKTVKSRLNEEILQKAAIITGGMYVRSSGAEFGLDLIYDERLSRMDKREIKSQMAKFYHERFQIPLAIALIFLFIESFISDKKRI